MPWQPNCLGQSGMDPPSVIVIARPELALAVRKRLGLDSGVAMFSASELSQALGAIGISPPRMVAMDAGVATTTRGAIFVTGIKTDPRLSGVDLRVLTEDEAHFPLFLTNSAVAVEAALLAGSMPLGRCGTRQLARFNMRPGVRVLANGGTGQLVDLSTAGAQLLTPARLRPDEPIRLTLRDDSTVTRVHGLVAWVRAELANFVVRYRVGVAFTNHDPKALEALCRRHGSSSEVSLNGSF